MMARQRNNDMIFEYSLGITPQTLGMVGRTRCLYSKLCSRLLVSLYHLQSVI